MSFRRLFSIASAVLALVASARAEEGWAQIKAGMTRAEMASALGEPLMKSSGRQFELCIYDAGAEVLCFRGTVMAWTAPAGSAAPDGRQLDLGPLLQAQAAPPAPVLPKVYVPHAERNGGYEKIVPRRVRWPRW